jgi:hypothetical protein
MQVVKFETPVQHQQQRTTAWRRLVGASAAPGGMPAATNMFVDSALRHGVWSEMVDCSWLSR